MNKSKISNTIINEIVKSLKNPKENWTLIQYNTFLGSHSMKLVMYYTDKDNNQYFKNFRNAGNDCKKITENYFCKPRFRKTCTGHDDFDSSDMPLNISFINRIRINLAVMKRLKLINTESQRMREEGDAMVLNIFLNENKKLKRNSVINEIIED